MWTDKVEAEVGRLLNALLDMAGEDAAFFVAALEMPKAVAMLERPSWGSALDAVQQLALETNRIVIEDRPINEKDGPE